ncbi:uncharacterized protein LOC114280479 [Camellia sinensis]|uniref:uncharacterized protein LOC114280479 n=1 Tax=Camellia sinensis TaxID=4442 RepID=UPI0010362272|nr:uncharacterized protein LOC114280479 [Camellia sinensis]
MSDLGKKTFFLGMEVKQKHNKIFICQHKYAKEILKKFNMEECKPTGTPMNQTEKFCKEDGTAKVDERLYKTLIGCLMYLTATRPVIMNAISLLLQYMRCASEIHFQAAKRIVRYIKGTIDYGLSFGYAIFSWCSKKQEVIAQSTAKTKYVVVAATVNQALWIRKLMVDLHMEQKESTQILADNQAANNPMFHGKTKHFKQKLYFLREWIRKKLIKRIQIKKNEMEKYVSGIYPNIHEMLEKFKVESKNCFATWCGQPKFEVDHYDRRSDRVKVTFTGLSGDGGEFYKGQVKGGNKRQK